VANLQLPFLWDKRVHSVLDGKDKGKFYHDHMMGIDH
jgi:hypothetical protein